MSPAITIDKVRKTARLIGPHIQNTPIAHWTGHKLHALLPNTTVIAKLEMFQYAGTFKARGALSNILRLSEQHRNNGVTAMSAGNHAVAVAYAAYATGIDAKIVVQKSANPARLEMARAYGAELLIADDGPSGFALAEDIAASENRAFIHPFDGVDTAKGTATLGLEFFEQAGELDILLVAIGGGGLAGGVSAITKQLNPQCRIFGVEPTGADSMYQSFKSGQAQNIGIPRTIADSLAPPMTLPIPFELCRENIDKVIRVSDDELKAAMRLIADDFKLAVEPACAATTAALLKLNTDLSDKRVGLVFCGSNIDWPTYRRYIDDLSV